MDNQKKKKIRNISQILREYEAMRSAGKIPADQKDELDELYNFSVETGPEAYKRIRSILMSWIAALIASGTIVRNVKGLITFFFSFLLIQMAEEGVVSVRSTKRIKKLGRKIDAIKAQQAQQNQNSHQR